MITDPADLPADRSAIPDDTLISNQVWAALQGVEMSTVYRYRTLAGNNRRAGKPVAGDYPPEDRKVGQTPMWRMGAYREWEASRPGKGAGAGRPRGSGATGRRVRVSLPIECPHCKHDITAADLGREPAAAEG